MLHHTTQPKPNRYRATVKSLCELYHTRAYPTSLTVILSKGLTVKLLIPPLVGAISSLTVFAYPISHLSEAQQMFLAHSVGVFLCMASLYLLFGLKKRSQSDSKPNQDVDMAEFWSK